MEASHPKKVKTPCIESFNGTTNLDDHLDVYKAQIYVQDVDSANCYYYFPTVLKGNMQKWLHGIFNGSITSFL